MNLDKYVVQELRNGNVYAFISAGIKGDVLKVVQYEKTAEGDTYNLAFGDFNVETGELDDRSITNNGDREKVLATVAATVVDFLNSHPHAKVRAQGSTEVRTWLYQRKLNQYFEEVTENFSLWGRTAAGWEEFERNKDYQAFLIQPKS
jgi:hypothetical protein